MLSLLPLLKSLIHRRRSSSLEGLHSPPSPGWNTALLVLYSPRVSPNRDRACMTCKTKRHLLHAQDAGTWPPCFFCRSPHETPFSLEHGALCCPRSAAKAHYKPGATVARDNGPLGTAILARVWAACSLVSLWRRRISCSASLSATRPLWGWMSAVKR